jgi:galactonate dehydratase
MSHEINRRSVIGTLFGSLGLGAFARADAVAQKRAGKDAPVSQKDKLAITKVETIRVKPRWLFLKIHTNAGIVGLGEPILESRPVTCEGAIKEMTPYLIGKDPRPVAHHWQALYRHTFYRGGPILTSAISGIDQALWDIKGKALGVPVYELLGGPTRNRVRVYAHVSTPEALKEKRAEGFLGFKMGAYGKRFPRYMENPREVDYVVERFAALRQAGGKDVDIAIDFHGAVSPALAKVIIKGLEPYQPMFVEEPVQAQNHDVMAEVARGTFIPIATGERVYTKWGFREVLEKKAATILQPDMCHAGGITEVRLIAGMAEAYYAAIAPHNPLGPISLASAVQLAASIPNFLTQEQSTLGEGYLKKPFKVREGYLDLPTGPGLGIELDENAMADKLGHDYRSAEDYDAYDGSVVDR